MQKAPRGKDKGWHNSRLLLEPDRHNARGLWFRLLAIVVACAPAAGYLLHQNTSLELAYNVNDLRVQNEKLVEQQRQLTVDRAALESLPNIEAWAARRSDLVPAPDGNVVIVQREADEPMNLLASTPARDTTAMP